MLVLNFNFYQNSNPKKILKACMIFKYTQYMSNVVNGNCSSNIYNVMQTYSMKILRFENCLLKRKHFRCTFLQIDTVTNVRLVK